MGCQGCGAVGRVGARFCDHCGERLLPETPSDGAPSLRAGQAPAPPLILQRPAPAAGPFRLEDAEMFPDVAAFPPSLAADAGADAGHRPGSHPGHLGEQRHVTVMFCDLVDSTEQAQRLELEEWRDRVRAFQGLCYREVSRAGGFVAQYLGDGVLAYFGYPTAHEQDARAAVRAAMAIVRELRAPGAGPTGAGALLIRIGVDSGMVLASQMGYGASRQPLVIGNVPNRAARIQAAAGPNTVVISEATHRLVHGSFVCERIGPHRLRGQDQPVTLFRVTRARTAQRPLDGDARLTPLVGRSAELGTLRARWDQARQGRGQIVILSGEAGVGKSRLLRELKSGVAGELHFKAEFRGAPNSESSVLWPVLEYLRQTWRLDRSLSREEARARITRGLGARAALADALPLMASLLEVSSPDDDASLGDTSPRRKQRTLELLAELLVDSAAARPTLLIIEDLHWVDPSSRELIKIVAARIPSLAVLMVLSLRPEGSSPLEGAAAVTQLALQRLDPRETESMVRGLVGDGPGGSALPPELIRDLVAKSDGVPLYVEEVTRLVVDSGLADQLAGRAGTVRSLAELGVPATLQESMIARLDRAGPAKDLAQICAVIGRSFDLDLIEGVSGLDGATLHSQLARLKELDILHPLGGAPLETLVFRHALIQDAAYSSLVRSRRRELHRRIGETLATRFSERVETRPELLAHHWVEAGRPEAAVPCLLSAGERAFERSAYAEAASHLQRGLALIAELPDGEARRGRELELCLALGPVLVATRGYSNPDVERIYARARALCPGSGDDRLMYAVLSGLHLFHQSRAELAICAELTERRLEIARRLEDPALEMHVLETAGTVAFWRGQHQVALRALGDALSRYDASRGRAIRLMYGTDSRVVSEAYEALALWYSGDPTQARARSLSAVAHAREIADVHSLALALVFSAIVHLNRGDLDAAHAQAQEAVQRCTEQRLEQWLGSALFVNGLVLLRLGQSDQGVAALGQGAAVYGSVGATVGGRFFAAGLGEAYLLSGKPHEGLGALAALSAAFPAGEDTCHDADLARVHGELLLAATGDVDAGTAALNHGLALARAQGARSLELRCAIALARLWRRQGRSQEARGLVAPIRAHFSDGDPTTDSRAADLLLS